MATKRRVLLVNSVLGVSAAALVAVGITSLGSDDSTTTSPLRTAAVSRGVVLTSVSASGNVDASPDLSLSFQGSGKVTAINVVVGQQVVAGQVLAQLDSKTASASLASAQAGLVSAQAKLHQLDAGETEVERASDGAAVAQAQLTLSNAQQKWLTDQPGLQNAVTQAQDRWATDACVAPFGALPAFTAPSQYPATPPTLIAPAGLTVPPVNPPTCPADWNAFQNSVNNYFAVFNNDQQAIGTAQAALNSTLATTAVKQQPPKPGDRAAAVAAVATGQSQVANAQLTLSQTQLIAPTAGTVAAINGTVGVPPTGSAASSGSTGTGTGTGTAASSASTSSSGFITLTDLSNLTVVAGFTEADAGKIKVGQPASATFAGLNSAQANGRVESVATNSTVVSNVVTYSVTILLTQSIPGLKPGMTASVSVVADERDNVLKVPSGAVTGTGANTTVTVVKNGKQSTVNVVVGLRGDDSIEIKRGVTEGQQVALSTTSGLGALTGGSLPTGFPFGGGGLGGGGLGGGGLSGR